MVRTRSRPSISDIGPVMVTSGGSTTAAASKPRGGAPTSYGSIGSRRAMRRSSSTTTLEGLTCITFSPGGSSRLAAPNRGIS